MINVAQSVEGTQTVHADAYTFACDAENDIHQELGGSSASSDALVCPKKLFVGLAQTIEKAAFNLNCSLELWILKLAGI